MSSRVMAASGIDGPGRGRSQGATACGLQGGGFRITEITATKSFDSRGRLQSSRFEILTSGNVPAGTVSTDIGPVTVNVPGDPDELSVSRDLGWAGLDASVALVDETVGHTVPVDIHLSLFANGGLTRSAIASSGPPARPRSRPVRQGSSTSSATPSRPVGWCRSTVATSCGAA